ncbi:hypothetical protein PN836_002490 [Ningiella sp. W23]|uniref:hypothetical protein n=1 Tax=Ningiella sp. W23 TaxID=3023715 RepID=UPI003756C852
MFKIILFVSITAYLFSAQAIASPDCFKSERFGNALIKVGDSERSVIESKPDRETKVETIFGGALGLRFDFYKKGRTIQVFTEDGVVVRICRVRD